MATVKTWWHTASVFMIICGLVELSRGTCPMRPTIPHTSVTMDQGTTTDSFVFYRCSPAPQYEPQEDVFNRVSCLADGTWSLPYPRCEQTTYQLCNGQEWRHYSTSSTFAVAKAQCTQDGGFLSNSRSSSDTTCALAAIPEGYRSSTREYWIGLEDEDGDGQYRWTSDNTTEMSGTPEFNPQNVAGQCGYFEVGQTVQVSPCTGPRRSYLCTREVPQYTACGTSEYHYFTSSYQWDLARVECEQQGGHLANIRSDQDVQCGLQALPNGTSLATNIRIGLHRNVTDSFIRWISDRLVQLADSPLWRSGQPFAQRPGMQQYGFWTPSLGIGLGSNLPSSFLCQRPVRNATVSDGASPTTQPGPPPSTNTEQPVVGTTTPAVAPTTTTPAITPDSMTDPRTTQPGPPPSTNAEQPVVRTTPPAIAPTTTTPAITPDSMTDPRPTSTTEPETVAQANIVPTTVSRVYPPSQTPASIASPLRLAYLTSTCVYLQCVFTSHHYIRISWNTTSTSSLTQHETLANSNASLGGSTCGATSPRFVPSTDLRWTFKSRLLMTDVTRAMSGFYSCQAQLDGTVLNSATFAVDITDTCSPPQG